MKHSRKYLVKKLDKIFSEYVRKKNMDKNEEVECYTCGKKYHWKKIQCGHFQSRKFYSTRWELDNCRPQCYSCNVMRYGEQYLFGMYLDRELGKNFSKKMLKKSREIKKFHNFELTELIEKYSTLVSDLDS